jgi:DnaA family protein
MKQIPLAIAPAPLVTFDSTVPGANAAALAHLHALQVPAAPVYLWGPAGSGKTRLLQALAHRLHAEGQRVGWFDASTPLPWVLQPEWTAVVLDGCEALDAEAQHAAFTLFVEAGTQQVQWAAAGRLPPVDLPLRDDLRTRLAWGHVFALQPLTEAETRAALRREADRRSFFFSDEVMDHLLTRFPRDLKTLMALLDRLDGYSLARGRRITVPLLREMLAEDAPVTNPAADPAAAPAAAPVTAARFTTA